MRASIPDAHCHLDQLPDAERAVEEALAAGVAPILAVGMERRSNERVLQLASRFPGVVLPAVGVHPSEIPAMDEARLASELEFVHEVLPAAVALGEVGLDYKDARDETQRERQRGALARQLEWAAALRKPANLHCRRAERDLLECAAAFAGGHALGANLHWFTHSAKLARRCGTLGLYISPGPSILHSDEQARVAALVHPDLLLLETDSPVEYGGEPARPAWAARVAERLAALRGEALETLAERLQANLKRYLSG